MRLLLFLLLSSFAFGQKLNGHLVCEVGSQPYTIHCTCEPVGSVCNFPQLPESASFPLTPDAPSTAQPPSPPVVPRCGPKWMGGCWDYNYPNHTWKETFTSPWWYGPTAVWIGADVFDAEVTHAGLAHHRCVEGNADLPFHPSRGQLYLEFAKTEAPLIGLGTVISKLDQKGKVGHWFPRFIYLGMASYAVTKHIQGASGWLEKCW